MELPKWTFKLQFTTEAENLHTFVLSLSLSLSLSHTHTHTHFSLLESEGISNVD